MNKKIYIVSFFIFIIVVFIFGRSIYIEYLVWYYGSNNLIFSEVNSVLLFSLCNGFFFVFLVCIIYVLFILLKRIFRNIVVLCLFQFCINIGFYMFFVVVERGYSKLYILGLGVIDIIYGYFLGVLFMSIFLIVVIVSVIYVKFFFLKYKDGLYKGV